MTTEAERIVAEQAEDERLWFIPVYATEAILQQALRRLHAAIEGKSPEQCAAEALATHPIAWGHPGGGREMSKHDGLATLVPLEPTPEMLAAAGYGDATEEGKDYIRLRYRLMIAAAPRVVAENPLNAAAPDLLSALQEAVCIMTGAGSWHTVRFESERKEAVERARAAIARATGEQP